MSLVGATEGLSELDETMRAAYIKDLQGVGINNPVQLSRVFVGVTDGSVKRAIKTNIQGRQNVLIFGLSGFGKSCRNGTGVLTEKGYQAIETLQVGDLVASNDGKFYPVQGVFPQGKQPVYEIEFNYGIRAYVSDNHIWTISRDYGKTYHNETTKEILEKGYCYKEPGTGWVQHKVELPPIQALEMPEKDLPVDPYLLGCLIGDGNLSSDFGFSSADKFIVDRVNSILSSDWAMQLKHRRHADYSITFLPEGRKGKGGPNRTGELKLVLNSLNLLTTAKDRHIPKEYLFASVEQRRALLAGLMDTDGFVAKNNSMEYATVSERLAKDVKFLAETLGIWVKEKYVPYNWYSHNGERRPAKSVYFLTFYGNSVVGSIPRKVDRQCPVNSLPKKLRVYDIQYVGEEECTCISVGAPNKLFLIDGAVPTHNTHMVKQIGDELDRNVVTITTSTKVPEDFGGRPMSDEQRVPTNINRALISTGLRQRKAKPEIEKALANKQAELGRALTPYQKEAIISKIINSTDVSDEEITAEIANNGDTYKRLREVYAAPDWVYSIMDDYLSTGKKTIVFLDEINQASPEVINTLFQLVDVKMFADKKEYDMSKAITFVAAGNFLRENNTLQRLPEPFVRRFPFIIINPGDWDASIQHLYEKYEDVNKDIANLIADVGPVQWKTAFQNPAQVESTINFLLAAIEDGFSIDNINDVLVTEGIPKQKIKKFIDDHDLSTQRDDTMYSATASPIHERTKRMADITALWSTFKRSRVARLKGADGAFISDPTAPQNGTTFNWGRPGSKEAFKEALVTQLADVDLPDDFWDTLE